MVILGNKRRNKTDREILGKTVSLEHSCLIAKEKVDLYALLHKYKDASS